MKTLIHFVHDENGATATEYAVITGVVALASFTAFIGLGVKFLMVVLGK